MLQCYGDRLPSRLVDRTGRFLSAVKKSTQLLLKRGLFDCVSKLIHPFALVLLNYSKTRVSIKTANQQKEKYFEEPIRTPSKNEQVA